MEYEIQLKLKIYEDFETDWVATVNIPKLKYIIGVGDTVEEACKALKEALILYHEIKETGV